MKINKTIQTKITKIQQNNTNMTIQNKPNITQHPQRTKTTKIGDNRAKQNERRYMKTRQEKTKQNKADGNKTR